MPRCTTSRKAPPKSDGLHHPDPGPLIFGNTSIHSFSGEMPGATVPVRTGYFPYDVHWWSVLYYVQGIPECSGSTKEPRGLYQCLCCGSLAYEIPQIQVCATCHFNAHPLSHREREAGMGWVWEGWCIWKRRP